jgi:hypothetical protein
MTDMQLVALAVTLLAIVAAMYANRKSLEDARDVLRAEFKAGFAGASPTPDRRASVVGGVSYILARHNGI